jgi:hypothetical protein
MIPKGDYGLIYESKNLMISQKKISSQARSASLMSPEVSFGLISKAKMGQTFGFMSGLDENNENCTADALPKPASSEPQPT